MKTIDRSRLASLMSREQKKFVDERPKSKAYLSGAKVVAGGRSHELDGEVGGGVSTVCAVDLHTKVFRQAVRELARGSFAGIGRRGRT
jgi:hypothetical protein